MRTKTQKIVIQRNWLFGRLAAVRGNLSNMIKMNTPNFTPEELSLLNDAETSIMKVLSDKTISSKLLKQRIT